MSGDDDNTTHEAPRNSRAAAKAERRLNLIDATITSIAKYGLSGTTLARVTEIAGTSLGLANFHFESKERLFEAVLTHLADEQRALWQNRNLDASLSSADRLMAILDSRFHSRICDRKKLAIWFAFYGDAGARDIYRKVVGDLDDELLDATVAILRLMIDEGGYTGIDPTETALAMEAMYDGLWLNMLLYPSEFKRLDCRARALDFIAAILPRHFHTTRGKG
jgi:TetR/AcrR family transcriptional regulator, transcriptional repressor of bet genes